MSEASRSERHEGDWRLEQYRPKLADDLKALKLALSFPNEEPMPTRWCVQLKFNIFKQGRQMIAPARLAEVQSMLVVKDVEVLQSIEQKNAITAPQAG